MNKFFLQTISNRKGQGTNRFENQIVVVVQINERNFCRFKSPFEFKKR